MNSSMNSVQICCEGAACNGGQSSAVREAAIVSELPTSTEELRNEAAKHARSVTSHHLAVTTHRRVSTERRGGSAA
jgi:hypothetical protein